MPFPDCGGHLHSLASGPFLLFMPTPLHPCGHPSIVPSPSDSPPSSTFRDPRDDIGSTWIIHKSLPISGPADSNDNSTCNLNSPLSCDITSSQAVSIKTGTSLEGYSYAYHPWADPQMCHPSHKPFYQQHLPHAPQLSPFTLLTFNHLAHFQPVPMVKAVLWALLGVHTASLPSS